MFFQRYRLVKQLDQTDCGAACLASIAAHYRIHTGLQTMRQYAGTDQVGTTLLGLLDAAEKIGFSARAVKGPYEALTDVPLPAIAHITTEEGYGHYVVLYRATSRGVVIADPDKGIRRLSADQFKQLWTGFLIVLTPEACGPALGGRQPKSPARRLMSLSWFHRRYLLEALLCAVLMTVLGISTSYFVQHLIDSVLVRGEMQLLNAMGIAMAGIVIVRILFGLIRQYLMAHVGRHIDLALVSEYCKHVLSLPMSFFETRNTGEIISRVGDAAKIRDVVGGAALTVVVDGFLVMAVSAVLWIYDMQLAMVATAFAPLMGLCVLAHQPSAKRRSRQVMEDAARHQSHLVEDVGGVETIKAFGCERQRGEKGEDRLAQLAESVFQFEKLGISLGSTGAFINAIAGVVVLWYGGHRVIEGALTIGELMFFYTLLGYMLGPLERLASVNLEIQDALVAMDRIDQIMNLEPECHGDQGSNFVGVRDGIRFRAASFRYGGREQTLREIDMEISAGSTVAIVGHSGCGKSTLLKLLMRYYEPSGGSISIDGVDLRDIDSRSLRSRIGWVSQDAFVFNGTIAENIAVGVTNATGGQIAAAARAAGLADYIDSLPDRYQTRIGERGANLSGGQRQRLAIARAVLRRPEILLFDEATSQLDTATERTIQNNLLEAFEEQTVVMVAHRLSTIRQADQIYVMDQGRIVERGQHQDLLQLGGRYAELWQCQSQNPGEIIEDGAVMSA